MDKGASICSLCMKFYHSEDCIRSSMHTQFDGITELRKVLQKILASNYYPEESVQVCIRCNNELTQIYSVMHRYSKNMLPPIRKAVIRIKKQQKVVSINSSGSSTVARNKSHGSATDMGLSEDDCKDSRLTNIQLSQEAAIRLNKLKFDTEENFLNTSEYRSVGKNVDYNSFEGSLTVLDRKPSLDLTCTIIKEEEQEVAEKIEDCLPNQGIKFEFLENMRTEDYQAMESSNISASLIQSFSIKDESIVSRNQEMNAENSFKCDQSRISFGNQQNLQLDKTKTQDSQQLSVLKKQFKCDECEKSFTRKRTLQSHKELHTGIMFNCDHCIGQFRSTRNLQIHKRRMHSDIRFKCDQCNRNFFDKDNLNRHKAYHAENNFQCDQCNANYSCRRKLYMHKRKKHKNIRFKCDQCDKNFLIKDSLENHKVLKHTENRFDCDQSSTSYRNKPNLDKHKREDHMELKKQYKCDQCQKQFHDLYRLKRHQENHPNWHLKCDQCEKDFTDKRSFRNHKRLHTGNRYVCDECGANYAKERFLQRHQRKAHSRFRDERLKCEQCNKYFQCPTAFKNHQELHAGYSFSCDYCNTEFRTRRNLRAHILKRHSDLNKKYKCKRCLEQFDEVDVLKRHLDVNDGNCQRFKCEQCKSIFIDRRNLNDHKTLHAGTISSFDCDMCTAKFPSNRFLQKHKRKEHRNPLYCDQCKKYFRCPTAYKTHLELHAETTFRCDQCSVDFRTKRYLQAHKLKKHSDKFKCNKKCQIVFSSSIALIKHQELNAGNIFDCIQGFKCDQCEKEFGEERRLRKHQSTAHVVQIFKCDLCDAGFRQKRTLRLHKSKIHDIVEVFECQQCNTKFKSYRDLGDHKRKCEALRKFGETIGVTTDQSFQSISNNFQKVGNELLNSLKFEDNSDEEWLYDDANDK